MTTGCLVAPAVTLAQSGGEPKPPASMSNPIVGVLIAVAGGLLIVIISLGGSLLKAARRTMGNVNEGAGEGANAGAGGVVRAGAAVATGPLINGVSDTAFYFIAGVIALEVVVALYLLVNLKKLTRMQGAQAATRRQSFSQWWSRINRFKPIDEEAELDLGHDYDGIRELNNRLPPWWLYGFYCSILFAGVYLYRYHVAHSAPLPAEEYRIAVSEADARKADYLKKAANNVDENSVKLMTAKSDLDAGRTIFETTCFACHGKSGEGGVGPNLTDKYWLHGGTINEVFKTIKYGYAEKGMKSWKDDYSPVQIAQLASYIKSLGGTNPPNAKPPQGTLMN